MKRQQQQAASKPKRERDEVWKKIKSVTGLYQYRNSRTFFANVRKSGKLHTESLHTKEVSALDREGRTIWIVDAHGYGKRFIIRADEKLNAFLELESLIPGSTEPQAV